MEERLWYKFTEHNDHEGETWHFFVKLTEAEHKHIKNLIESDEEYWLGDSYDISDKVFDEEKIATLVENSDEGYMPTYNKTNPNNYGNILELTAEAASDDWYKGQFWYK